jgi:hypothetical protein
MTVVCCLHLFKVLIKFCISLRRTSNLVIIIIFKDVFIVLHNLIFVILKIMPII